MPRLRVGLFTLFFSTLCAQTALGEGPTLKPGKWEVTTVSQSSMGKPKTTSLTECVKEDKDPLDIIMEADTCKISDKTVKDYTVTWKMECGEENAAKGKGTFTADGNSGEGVIEMDFVVQGMAIHVKNTWKGKRIGDCDPAPAS
jgi:hypothetical protein